MFLKKQKKTKTNKNKDKKKQDKTAPIGFALSVSICRGREAATIRSRLWCNDQICKFCFLFCGIYKGVPDVNWCNSIIKQTMPIFHKIIFKYIFHKRKSLYMLPKVKCICMLKRKFCVASF